jgi:hypothetical protein
MSSKCVPVLRSNNTVNGKKGEMFSITCGAVAKKLNFVMEKHGGPRPKGMLIRHLCENDSSAPNGFICCNPEHIVWGTWSENALDTVKDGKHISKRYPEKCAACFDKANKILLECPHCGALNNVGLSKQHHFDNCKYKPTSTSSLDNAISYD